MTGWSSMVFVFRVCIKAYGMIPQLGSAKGRHGIIGLIFGIW